MTGNALWKLRRVPCDRLPIHKRMKREKTLSIMQRKRPLCSMPSSAFHRKG